MVSAIDPAASGEINKLPQELRESVATMLERANSVQPSPTLIRMLACSEYAGQTFIRESEWLAEQGEHLLQPPRVTDLQRFCDAIARSTEPVAAVQRQIRQFRNRYFLHVLWREYAGIAALNETLHAISDLADYCLRGATAYAQRMLESRFGSVRDEVGEPVSLVILGMGKLGGRELNFSSDIDLIFLYPGGVDSDGAKSLSAHEYFTRVSRTVIALIETPTADGFAFRVDTRLRPFGDSGPPVTSFAALESYLVQHGRGWERYAYVKARAVGPIPPSAVMADLFDDIISPFVYRRYLDYGVFESLREMHSLIAAEVKRRELADNVKLGQGGIREIEFIVQSLQLVRGGEQLDLRSRQLQVVLPRLAAHHDIGRDAVDDLLQAYTFLRRTENFIQAMRDQQTHDLPTEKTDRARLALAMGCQDWQAFRVQLDHHRSNVAQHFETIAFRQQKSKADDGLSDQLLALWKGTALPADWEAFLQTQGFEDATGMADTIAAFKSTAAHVDTIASQRLQQFIAKLIVLLQSATQPDVALARTLSIVERVLRRSAYIALLNENTGALARLVDLCSRSAYVAKQISRHPVLLDELLNPGIYVAGLSRESMAAELQERGKELADSDSESQTEMLARFQRTTKFRIAVADFNENLPIMRVSDALTELAEAVLDYALQIAWRDLTEKHGKPGDAGFAIIAYGKFGGLELSYGSDLDLVFLHDATASGAATDGPKPLEQTMFYTRLVRRLVHILTTQTASGVLYEVDTRLRPDGQSGLLVTSVDAFARYQEENAWTWEHQALLRARAVVGSDSICRHFAQVRSNTLTSSVHTDTLRDDVISMREKMRRSLDKSDAQHFDLKQGSGGIGDIEFLVQYLVLANAAEFPAVIEFSDNIRQLDSLGEKGLLGAATVERLQEIYRAYRHRVHHLLLNDESTLIGQDEFSEERCYVSETWTEHLGRSAA